MPDSLSSPKFIPLSTYQEYSSQEMLIRARDFQEEMQRRRTVRDFSSRPVPREIIEQCLRAAGTAPSGANMQPWHFVAVENAETKRQIRIAAEEEERDFYENRAPQEWLDALAPLGTDSNKPFLEIAPYLIAVFAEKRGVLPDGRAFKHYYVQESVGIAVGILLTALHRVRSRFADAYAKPDEFFERYFTATATGAPVFASCRRLSR